jgi:hypothetical protein
MCCWRRCLDLSSSRRKLALVDETNTVVVYDLHTKVSRPKRCNTARSITADNRPLLGY